MIDYACTIHVLCMYFSGLSPFKSKTKTTYWNLATMRVESSEKSTNFKSKLKMFMLILGTCRTTFVFMSMLKSVRLSSCQVARLSGGQVVRLSFSLGHAEQLLFSCLCSKVSSCQVVRLSSLILGTC